MSTTRRLVLLSVVVLLLVGGAIGVALSRDGDDHRTDPPAGLLTVTWGGTDGRGCTYDSASGTVVATLLVTGSPPRGDEPVLTVTAFADENTSRPVGSTSRSLDAATPSPLVLTIPVDRAPHVDEDGVAACSMAVAD